MSYGFEMAGFEVVLAIDMWEDAIKTFNFNHKKDIAICENIQNITNVFLNQIKNKSGVVGVIGGPPCQGFSTVGKRVIDDPRNSLYLEYCRIVEQLQPKFFVLENVKGLLTLNNGKIKEDICNRFSQLGYDVQYQILNAADFGVPQNRLRIFFIGIKGKTFVFPKKDVAKPITCSEALSDMPILTPQNGLAEIMPYTLDPITEYQKKIRNGASYLKNNQITIHSEQTLKIIKMIKDGESILDLPRKYWGIRKYNKAFERMSANSPANTVDTGHRNYFHYSENRIPTARENARLQSFPDTFEFLGTKGSQYKQIGNAVPPLLAKKIAIAIKKQIEE